MHLDGFDGFDDLIRMVILFLRVRRGDIESLQKKPKFTMRTPPNLQHPPTAKTAGTTQ